MYRRVRSFVGIGTLLMSLGNMGCLKKILFDGQVASTRKGADAVSTVSDFEVAKTAALGGLAQFEGMHYLGPWNEDAMFMLTRGWAGAAFGFMEDEMERAEDQFGKDSELALYHKARAVAGYERAVHYGTKLLDTLQPGFKDATRNAETLTAYLDKFTDAAAHTPYLFWTGQAWMGRVNLLKAEPTVVAELFVGRMLIERAVALDETYGYGSGHVILGAYHARTALAELDDAKKHFDRALEISKGGALLAKYQLAVKYHCNKGDKASYVKLLQEVLDAGDVLPEQRLQNTLAKRRAKRYLRPDRMAACGFEG